MEQLRSSLLGTAGGGGLPAGTFGADAEVTAQLTDLAKQLSVQMDYNNELLGQIQRLEEAQLAAQRAASDKQASMRQAMAVAEAARAEANDLRRKLAVAQVREGTGRGVASCRLLSLAARGACRPPLECIYCSLHRCIALQPPRPTPHTAHTRLLQEVSGKLSEEAKEARVEAGILRRQQEALEKLAMEARCVLCEGARARATRAGW